MITVYHTGNKWKKNSPHGVQEAKRDKGRVRVLLSPFKSITLMPLTDLLSSRSHLHRVFLFLICQVQAFNTTGLPENVQNLNCRNVTGRLKIVMSNIEPME